MIDLQAVRLTDGLVFPEGLKWRNGELWLSDVFDHRVYAVSTDGRRRLVCKVPTRPSGLGFLPDGTLIIASATDRTLLRTSNVRKAPTELGDPHDPEG